MKIQQDARMAFGISLHSLELIELQTHWKMATPRLKYNTPGSIMCSLFVYTVYMSIHYSL